MRFFDYDSPFMQGLTKMADLMILNLITICCCLPIVTIGPALTAMNYMALKICRDENNGVVKPYFKSFKQNFIQGTIIGLLVMGAGLVLAFDLYAMAQPENVISNVIRVAVLVATVLLVFITMFVFPVLARFENTVFKTIKNALLLSMIQFPKTVLMILMYSVTVIITFYVFQLMPYVFLFGLALPAWVSAKLYNKIFLKLEGNFATDEEKEIETDENGEDVRIFKDELDPALAEKDMTK